MLIAFFNFIFIIFVGYFIHYCFGDFFMMADGNGQDGPSGTPERGDRGRILAALANDNINRTDAYVSAKIPKFYKQDPVCWFFIVEASFAQTRITTEITKAHAIVAQLDSEIVAHIKDIIISQPADIYSQIKARLISIFSVSNETRLRQLLKGEVINEGKPSLVLNQLRSLNGNTCSDDVLKSIFMDQLPGHIRAILAMSEVNDLTVLANLADKVFEASNPSGFQISAVTSPCPVISNAANTCAVSSVDSLTTVVDQLTRQMEKLSKQLKQSSQWRGNGRNRSKSRNSCSNFGKHHRSKSISRKNKLCFYHNKYRESAHKCQEPCSWKLRASSQEN